MWNIKMPEWMKSEKRQEHETVRDDLRLVRRAIREQSEKLQAAVASAGDERKELRKHAD